MAIHIYTIDPNLLLAALKSAIDEGKILTWTYDQANDFTHTPEQWAYKAWLRPSIYAGELRLNILGRKDEAMTKSTYGVYHGRFIEAILTHFDDYFTTANASADLESGDTA